MSCSTSLAACVCSAGHFSPTGCPCQQCVHRSYIVANQGVCIDCWGMSTQLPPTPPATSPPAFYQVITPLSPCVAPAPMIPTSHHSVTPPAQTAQRTQCPAGLHQPQCLPLPPQLPQEHRPLHLRSRVRRGLRGERGEHGRVRFPGASTRPSGQFTTAESIQTEIVPPILRSVVQFRTVV